jgi:hypothetical protein
MPPASVAPPAWGVQEPRIATVPPCVSSAGAEAVDLARMAGLHLDPWQQFVLQHALGERPDGKWAAFEVGLVVSRQNGKGSLLEARELAGLFLLDERLVIHSAHQFDTSLEAFQRLLHLVENTPDLSRRVKRVSKSHGEEGIQLTNGQRIRFRTRTKGGGRGFTCDCLILDEAMILPESTVGALLPTLSARPNPQVWYTGSAVDQDVHDQGMSLARVRKRGLSGTDPSLAYFEFSPDVRIEHAADVADDFEAWRQSNPALGFRISAEHIERERVAMDPKTFAVERLGIGDWPDPDEVSGQAINPQAWASCTDRASMAEDPVCFAFDVRPDRSGAAIAAAGRRPDGLAHVEVVEHHPGTGWVVGRLAELVEQHKPLAVICDAAGPAASLLAELDRRGVVVTVANAKDHAQACGTLFDGVHQKSLRHGGTPELAAAIKGAVKRPLGDAWAWSRKSSAVDISPLVACTLALWGIGTQAQKAPPRFINLAEV